MGTRCLAAVVVGVVWCLAAPAHADPRSEVAAKTKAAMASYDSMDYDAARKQLNQALAIAKKAKLDKDPIVARAYLDLGIAELAGGDLEAARVAFLSAVQIDPTITIDAAYKSPELVKLLDEARAAAGGDGGEAADDECEAVRGLQHTIIDSGKPGVAQPIEALIGGELAPARVVVMYRPEGAIDFTEARLARTAGCRFAGAIPAAGMQGKLVHYYIAAYDATNKVLAAKGSSGTPNIIELVPGPPRSDAEDPIRAAAGELRGAARGASPASSGRSWLVGLAGGTGFGYVTGRTEGNNVVETCCIGSSLVVLTPELAYRASPRLSVGVAVRIGFPIGANLAGHSSMAPAGFVRARYALSPSGDGLRVMAELGGGILRNTIKVTDMGNGMDVDVVAQGPLLIGAGIGYTKRISPALAFFVDVDAIAGIAIVDEVGSAIHLNTGISADMSLGVAFGF